MNEEYTDCFEIINGPEDGVSFSVMRTPVNIGASADCAIYMNFDRKIMPVHARVTVVSGGYRIRSVSGSPVYINRKRSGMVWARIARSGDIIQVGDTSLCLACVPDGLANRSIGMPTESNFAWLLQVLLNKLLKTGAFLFCFFFKMLSRVNRGVLFLIVGITALFFFQPVLFYNLLGWARFFWYRISNLIASLM